MSIKTEDQVRDEAKKILKFDEEHPTRNRTNNYV